MAKHIIRRRRDGLRDGGALWTTHDMPEPGSVTVHDFDGFSLLVRRDAATDTTRPASRTLSLAMAKPGETDGASFRSIKGILELDLTWSDAYTGPATTYDVRPTYPLAPVCVRLLNPFTLPPEASVEGWILTDLDVEALVAKRVIASYQAPPVRKTLYGNTDTGIVCRFNESRFLMTEEEAATATASRASAVHPVRIRNTADHIIRVSELCIYGDQLSIFSKGERLWSERILFAFGDHAVRMNVEAQGRCPSGATCLAWPRVSGEEVALERSIEFFKAITRM